MTFMLTSGSTVNIAIAFVPYNMREASVSLRLRAVQVVELKPMEEQNPFGSVSGYDSKAKPQISGFEVDAQESPFPAASEVEAEEAPKKTTKKKVAPKSKEVDPELSEITGRLGRLTYYCHNQTVGKAFMRLVVASFDVGDIDGHQDFFRGSVTPRGSILHIRCPCV